MPPPDTVVIGLTTEQRHKLLEQYVNDFPPNTTSLRQMLRLLIAENHDLHLRIKELEERYDEHLTWNHRIGWDE